MTSTRTTAFADYARRAVTATRRVRAHVDSECDPDVAATMATVTPPGTFTWMRCYTWASPAPRADGRVVMALNTGHDAVAGFYAEGKRVFQLKSFGHPLSKFTTGWFGLFESTGHMDLVDRGHLAQDWVLFAPLDGTEGISGEIAWGRFGDREPGPDVTDNDRASLFAAYVDALRRGDTAGVLAVLSDDVVGAARDYVGTGGPEFVPVNGAAAARAHYDAFFAAHTVAEIEVVTLLMRGWYLFAELVWTVERRDDPGRPLVFVTGDLHALDVDGRHWAKAGFGTPMEPMS